MSFPFRQIFRSCIFLSLWIGSILSAQAQQNAAEKFWTPVPDDVYLQEVALKIPTEQPITGIGVLGNECFVIINSRIQHLKDNKLVEVKNSPQEVQRLITIQGKLWALSKQGIYQWETTAWKKIDSQVYVDLCLHNGTVYAATKKTSLHRSNLKEDITIVMSLCSWKMELSCMPILSNSGRSVGSSLMPAHSISSDLVNWYNLTEKLSTVILSIGENYLPKTRETFKVLAAGYLCPRIEDWQSSAVPR
jgi:hypothetical protein